jgi:hypothetical protein
MSWVANLMVQADMEDRAAIETLSAWLESEAPRRFGENARGVGYLAELTNPEGNHWGGWKNPECEVWAGALNQPTLTPFSLGSAAWSGASRAGFRCS